MSTPPLAGAGMPPGAFSGTQAQAAREVNTASLCRIGQETVQDIVFRTMEIFQLLRNMQLPNGVTYHTATYQDRLAKLQEHLRQLSILFRKLRLVYDKCNENCAGLDPVPIEQLIPYVEEDGSKHDDRGAASQLRFASEERREIMEVNKEHRLHMQKEQFSFQLSETETEKSAAEADHGSVTKSYLGHKCHVGNEELNKENQTL
uniref:Mediator of RNA polymerase II transcription subunit 30 n=1 Tax=Cyanoderma ruficeps TaxID=181631 RepID=A0A8C3XE10_9PASS